MMMQSFVLLVGELRVQCAQPGANLARLVCIARTQSLDPEQPDLCVFYKEVASNDDVTVDWCET